MNKRTSEQLKDSYEHIKPYLEDENCTKELREMCENCEKYCGEEHDYEECKELMCFKFFLAYEYTDWCNSY